MHNHCVDVGVLRARLVVFHSPSHSLCLSPHLFPDTRFLCLSWMSSSGLWLSGISGTSGISTFSTLLSPDVLLCPCHHMSVPFRLFFCNPCGCLCHSCCPDIFVSDLVFCCFCCSPHGRKLTTVICVFKWSGPTVQQSLRESEWHSTKHSSP